MPGDCTVSGQRFAVISSLHDSTDEAAKCGVYEPLIYVHVAFLTEDDAKTYARSNAGKKFCDVNVDVVECYEWLYLSDELHESDRGGVSQR